MTELEKLGVSSGFRLLLFLSRCLHLHTHLSIDPSGLSHIRLDRWSRTPVGLCGIFSREEAQTCLRHIPSPLHGSVPTLLPPGRRSTATDPATNTRMADPMDMDSPPRGTKRKADDLQEPPIPRRIQVCRGLAASISSYHLHGLLLTAPRTQGARS